MNTSAAHRIGNGKYLSLDEPTVNYFEISGRGATNDASHTKESYSDWNERTVTVGNYEYIPFGDNDDIPEQIIDSCYANHLVPRIQNRKVELLVEQGPYLYTTTVDGTNFTREPVVDKAIQQWLEEQGYEEALHCCASEYMNIPIVYNKIYRDRAGRIGNTSSISKVEPLSSSRARLAARKRSDGKPPQKATHVIVGDFKNKKQQEYEVYPLFDTINPTKYPVAIHYTARRSFGVPFYTVPEILGALNWINLSTSIPKILKALTENSLNIKWHIESPQDYWDAQEKKLKENLKEGEVYTSKMLDELEQQIMSKLSKLLSGVENVGKFWHNRTVVKLLGGNPITLGWKITAIEQKVKDYVKAQLEIADASARAVLTSLGLHSALANVGADGKSDSGAELLYALTNHQKTSVILAEHYVCKAFNDAIKAKFNKDVKIGFWHMNVAPLQDTTASQRPKAQQPTV